MGTARSTQTLPPPAQLHVPAQRLEQPDLELLLPDGSSEPPWVAQLMAPARDGHVVIPATVAADRTDTLTNRWQGRPGLARVLRAAIFAVPLISSVVVAVIVSQLVRQPDGLLATIGWWVLIMAAGTAAMITVDRFGRRLLPLAALLRMSLVFPDHAPSRFAVSARAGNIRSLERHLAGVRDRTNEPAKAAERIITLIGALAVHDRRTRGHSERVRAFTDLLSEELHLSPGDRERLRWAALLHDIGKLDVSPALLNKPSTPTNAEWRILREHPIRGAELAAPLYSWLGDWAATIPQHHERWDGGGYPFGLAGEEICIGARIVGVADAFEVMTAPRTYRRPVSAEAAREELATCAATHFDPVVVRAFLNISVPRLRKVMGPVSWLAQLPFIGMLPRAEALLGIFGREAASSAATAAGVGALTVGVLAPPVSHVTAAPAPPAAPSRAVTLSVGGSAGASDGTRVVSIQRVSSDRSVPVTRRTGVDRSAPGETRTTTKPRAVPAKSTAQAPAASSQADTAKGHTGASRGTTDKTAPTKTSKTSEPTVAAPRTRSAGGDEGVPARGVQTTVRTATRAATRTAPVPAPPQVTPVRRATEVAQAVVAVPAVPGVSRAVPAIPPALAGVERP